MNLLLSFQNLIYHPTQQEWFLILGLYILSIPSGIRNRRKFQEWDRRRAKWARQARSKRKR